MQNMNFARVTEARRCLRFMRGLAFVMLCQLGDGVAVAGEREVALYVHDSVQEQYLTRSVLRSIFTSRVRTWPNGHPARVFVMSDDDPLHIKFCQEYLGTYPYVLQKSWSRTKFSGIGLVPTRVGSLAEMRRLVDQTPGAIGYVSSGSPDADSEPSVILINKDPQ